MNEKLTEELNLQMNREFFSSYLYYAMNTYFKEITLDGFAKYMKKQAKEELKHAQGIHDYLIDRNAKINYSRIEAPDINWLNPLDVFEYAYKHEKFITGHLHRLHKMAEDKNDLACQIFLNGYIVEQVEEEAKFYKMIERIKTNAECNCNLNNLNIELM